MWGLQNGKGGLWAGPGVRQRKILYRGSKAEGAPKSKPDVGATSEGEAEDWLFSPRWREWGGRLAAMGAFAAVHSHCGVSAGS